MRALLDRFQANLIERHAPRTAQAYFAVSRAFLTAVGADAPSPVEVARFLHRPRADGGRRSVATWNHELAALRALAAFAVRTAAWPRDPTVGLAFQKPPKRSPSVLGVGEVRRLFDVVSRGRSTAQRVRDTALLALLASLGLRVHELVALDADQIDFACATLIAVAGKGGTVHDLPLNAPALQSSTGKIGSITGRA